MFPHHKFLITLILWFSFFAPINLVFVFFGNCQLKKTTKIFFYFDQLDIDFIPTRKIVIDFINIAIIENFTFNFIYIIDTFNTGCKQTYYQACFPILSFVFYNKYYGAFSGIILKNIFKNGGIDWQVVLLMIYPT